MSQESQDPFIEQLREQVCPAEPTQVDTGHEIGLQVGFATTAAIVLVTYFLTIVFSSSSSDQNPKGN